MYEIAKAVVASRECSLDESPIDRADRDREGARHETGFHLVLAATEIDSFDADFGGPPREFHVQNQAWRIPRELLIERGNPRRNDLVAPECQMHGEQLVAGMQRRQQWRKTITFDEADLFKQVVDPCMAKHVCETLATKLPTFPFHKSVPRILILGVCGETDRSDLSFQFPQLAIRLTNDR